MKYNNRGINQKKTENITKSKLGNNYKFIVDIKR